MADYGKIHWFVNEPVGVRTRIYYNDPSGANPLTPECIRNRYNSEIWNSALVFWHIPEAGIGGLRAGIDEVAWRDADIKYFETAFCRPAKASGHAWLTARCRDGGLIALLASDRCETEVLDYHFAVAALLEQVYPGLMRTTDEGYDA